MGSSPLARGPSGAAMAAINATRLIPARAGNIHVPAPLEPSTRAHPRSRGEHRLAALVGRLAAGSSPLARGTWKS